MNISNLINGLFFSIIIGGIVTFVFIYILRKLKNISTAPLKGQQRIGGVFIGIIERLFFTICTAYNLSGLVIGIIAWLTIKMATNHNLLNNLKDNTLESRNLALSALLSGLISMLFAIIGGLIVNGQIKLSIYAF